MKYTKEEVKESKNYLKKLFEGKNKTVYIAQKSVSHSGMTRKVNTYHISGESEGKYLNLHISRVTGFGLDKNGRIILRGCGMDMHFHLVYSVSLCLYGYTNGGAYKLKHVTL